MVLNEELEEEELGDQEVDVEEVKRELEWLEFEGEPDSRCCLILSK